MLDLREAEALYKQLGGILAHDALQHDQQSQREALRLSKALVWALEPPVNAAVEPAFTVPQVLNGSMTEELMIRSRQSRCASGLPSI